MKKKLWIAATLLVGMLILGCLGLKAKDAEAAQGTWKHNKTGWWYEYADGSYAKGWLQISGKWYYFLGSGYMESNGYRQGYWIAKNGVTNLTHCGGRWKHNKTGWWFEDKTGWYPVSEWLKINGKYYYFDEEGYAVVNRWVDGYLLDEDGVWVSRPSTDWAEKYMEEIDVFEGISKELWGAEYPPEYALAYIDDDSTPELVVHAGESSTPAQLYTYYDGKLQTFDLASSFPLYMPGTGEILDLYTSERKIRVSAFHLDDGVLVKKGEGSYDLIRKDDGQLVDEWKWDGEFVTAEEFNKAVEEVCPDQDKCSLLDFVSYEEITDQLYLITRNNK